MTIFGRKWNEEVTSHPWAFVASITEKIGWLTKWRIHEITELDDYVWRRATEKRK